MITSRLKECWVDRHICSVDPITLTGLAIGALGGIAGGVASGAFGGGSQPPAPAAPPPMAPPQQQPQAKPAKPQQPSFLGAAATPQAAVGSGSGQKTLLGQ